MGWHGNQESARTNATGSQYVKTRSKLEGKRETQKPTQKEEKAETYKTIIPNNWWSANTPKHPNKPTSPPEEGIYERDGLVLASKICGCGVHQNYKRDRYTLVLKAVPLHYSSRSCM